MLRPNEGEAKQKHIQVERMGTARSANKRTAARRPVPQLLAKEAEARLAAEKPDVIFVYHFDALSALCKLRSLHWLPASEI
jgi:hypothetical protein